MFTSKTQQLWGSTVPRLLFLALASAATVWGAGAAGIAATPRERIAVATFAVMVCSTVCFWNRRLAVALLGVAVLVATRTLSIPELAVTSRIHIILFLAGMMILVGIFQEMGLFSCLGRRSRQPALTLPLRPATALLGRGSRPCRERG